MTREGVDQVARHSHEHPTIAVAAAAAAAGGRAGDQIRKLFAGRGEACLSISRLSYTAAKPCAPDRVKGGGKSRDL